MRLTCPICGERDRREFYYQGDAVALHRPAPDADDVVWDDYLHNRDNPAGVTRDLWYHESGCSAWIVVTRNTVTHEVLGSELAAKAALSKSRPARAKPAAAKAKTAAKTPARAKGTKS